MKRDDAGATGPRHSAFLGAPCADDAGCDGPGLVCLASTSSAFLGGGPSGGLCVADCTDGGQSACADVDVDAVCVDAGGASYCLPGCSVGDAASDKCLGRADLGCVRAETEAGDYCQPTCASDAECSSRVCHLGLGVCVDPAARSGTLRIGAPCDRHDDQCSGVCSPLDPSGETLACSGGCSLGSSACGASPSTSPPFDAYCLLAPVSEATTGDLGLCVALCDCDDDCGNLALRCENAGPEAPDLTGHAGFCVVSAEASAPLACDGSR
jgi:hypothetical protein